MYGCAWGRLKHGISCFSHNFESLCFSFLSVISILNLLPSHPFLPRVCFLINSRNSAERAKLFMCGSNVIALFSLWTKGRKWEIQMLLMVLATFLPVRACVCVQDSHQMPPEDETLNCHFCWFIFYFRFQKLYWRINASAGLWQNQCLNNELHVLDSHNIFFKFA